MSYTSRILNYVEPYYIDGIAKTAFWTEVNTNLVRNDKVFIINGYYDSERFIKKGKWTKNADGYRVLFVDRCKVVVDIDWESGTFAGLTQTYRVDEFDNFIKLSNIRSQREFDYINKIYVDSYTSSRVSKFEKNYTNNIIYSYTDWAGATGLGGNSGLGATNSFWARVGYDWVNVTSQYLNNNFTFSSEYISKGLTNNSRLFILGEDLTYQNVLLKERNIYKWNATASWLLDTEYKQPIMSKLYFRTGVFKGIHNDGVFGTYLKSEQWNGWPSEWNSGFFVNSVWNAGRMKSKSTIFEASYYSTLVNGSPVQSTDFSDNRGYGYNYILDSDFISGSIDNGNFVNSNIGSYSTGLTAINEYFGVTNSYLMNITGGLYSYCDIYNSYLYSSTTVDSIIRNTFFEDTRTLNSQIKESYSKDGEFSTEEASINIISADMSSYMITATSGTSSSIRSILKLYIEDKDLIRLDNLDSFYLSNIDKEYLLSKLDSDTRIWLPIETKYILDTFYNFEVGAVNQECISSIKTKYENKFINIVEFDGMTYSNNSIVNDKVYASIDIDFSKYFAFYKYLEQYYYVNESYIDKSNVTNAFKNTKITNSDFRDGVAKNIIWNSGSHLNYPSNVIKWENNNLKISKVATDQIKVYLVATQSTINDGLFSTGSWAWLDSIVHTDNNGSQSLLTGAYTVANYTQDELTLQSSLLTGVSSSGTYSVLGTHKPKYLSVHKLLIEDSVVRKGLFIRNLFRNTLFEDESFDSNDRSLHNSNVQKLRILNHYFINSSNSVNTIKSGVFHNSHFTDINWLSGISDNSIWYGPEFKNGVFNYGIWQDGTFSGGVFQNSRGISYSVEDYSLVNTHYRNWFKGTFNGGDFYNSVWLDGTFNLGKFYGSDWYGGIWNNGILGDMNIPTSNTTMAKYLNIGTGATFTNWYNGMVDNAEVGGQGYIDWYNGKFNAGIFSSSASTSTKRSWWLDGQFNGGNFSGLAKWKKGTFNSGKFNSYYGFTLSSSTSSIDYGWEYGEFKGGQFGEESKSNNSTWFDGQFFDGIFKGKVWNTGIFLGGSFEGSGTISSISNTEIFSDSFSQSYWGLWRSGTITDLKHKADPSFVVPVNTTRVDEVIPQVRATLKNMLWVNGNFEHPYGEMVNSIWLSGKFKRGKFTGGVFNPFVRRDWWVDSYGTYSTFNFDFSKCVWENGDFDGDFYISDWLEGNFLGGTMSGARWFDGVWNYGNAINIYWENGTWKNGNWDGSPFDLNTLNTTEVDHEMKPSKERDILLRVANIHQDGKVHVINAFTGSFSDNLFEGWTFSDTSPELTDWKQTFSYDYWYLDYGLPSNPIIAVTETQYNTPDGYNTSTILVSDPVVELDSYKVFVYTGYISLTASSTDNADSIAIRLVNEINNGITQQIVKSEQWTANGYLTRYFTWEQLDSRLGATLPYANYIGSGLFTVQTPSDDFPYVSSESGFAGSSIYKESERIYAMIDDGTGLTTSIFTQSGIIYNISIDVYNSLGRTDYLVNVADNVYRETITLTGFNTLNYSFETNANQEPGATASTLYIERVQYDFPDNSTFQVQSTKINKLESFYDNIINNRLYEFDTYSTPFVYGPTGTTVSLPGRLLTGLVANNDPITIKYGNGAFKLGLWENGFWNNGWRAAWNSQEKEYLLFTDIIQGGFLQIIENLWIIQLKALTNTNEISIGDRVSIGNLVFIDINEKRRLIKKWFRVINKTIDTITVEINVNFSVRRIEKDSSAHLIYVSKNIWESGVFHNGYFKGIWNYGLFRGYPYITEMVQSHWVDGIFDGGTFKSDKSYYLSQGLSQSYNNGLIQNFIFRDNNRALLPGKFKFDSWVDTNYFTSSMTNLFKDNLRYDSNWGVVLSSGNLKGYPTEDVLSSISIFRNSFDNAVKYYSLGYKYKNYVDYLKSSSYFTYPFNTNGAPGPTEFLAQGWTYTANFIDLHSNSKEDDNNVLKVNYQQEAYSNVGVKFVQTSKIQYRNGNAHVTTRSRDPIYKWIDGDFSSSARYTVFINDIAQPAGTRFSNRSYLYDDFPLRTSISGQQKLNNNIENKETLSLFTNISTSITAPTSPKNWTLGGDTENSWRRVYMLDLFNPTQSDTSFGGYNIPGLVPNSFKEINRSGSNGTNVGGTSTWTFMQYYVINDAKLKINAFIPFEFSASETDTGSGLENRNGQSTFKIVGVIEKLPNPSPSTDEDKWEYVTSTELNFYPDSYFNNRISGINLYGYLVNKTNCTIVFDTTNASNKLRGYLKIDGYEADFKQGENLRFRLYWIDVRKMFASSNQTGDGAPGDMTLTIGKFSGINYSENNHGYWEVVDLSTYVNRNTNLLTNTNASKIEKFRYSVVDFDIKNAPLVKYQGTSSTPDDLLPNIFLLNSDYVGLPGNFSDVINHGLTTGNKKEYFYNRKSLDMFFRSTESFSVQFSKIQFYETDMIPFFRYTDESAVNKDPQSPYYGTAPVEPIAEGSLSLDTISFTSPFQGNIPIVGAIQIPGGGGEGIILPPPPVREPVTFRIDYVFENGSVSGVNEFTSFYSITEYTSSSTFVRTLHLDHSNTNSSTGFINVESTNYLELFVRGTYSVVPMNNKSRIIIPALSVNDESSSGIYSQLSRSNLTPTTSLTITLKVEADGYYYIAYPYDCGMMSTYGSSVILFSNSPISIGHFVCASGSAGVTYYLSSSTVPTTQDFNIGSSSPVCYSLIC